MASMHHFSIASVAEQSADFRRVLWTGEHAQLVIMTIPPGGEIGLETHEHTDQILTFVSGAGEADVAGQPKRVAPGANPLVLYTVYGPAEHAAGAVHATKEEADAAEESGQDEPPVG